MSRHHHGYSSELEAGPQIPTAAGHRNLCIRTAWHIIILLKTQFVKRPGQASASKCSDLEAVRHGNYLTPEALSGPDKQSFYSILGPAELCFCKFLSQLK